MIYMSQPIVPLEVPQSRRFEKKNRNDILLNVRLGKLELSLCQALTQDLLESILDKVLNDDYSAK
ncbi:IS66 family Orf1 protein [Streptococcus canis]|nr:IS66 family Orf1 protein [Streptococcus canis]